LKEEVPFEGAGVVEEDICIRHRLHGLDYLEHLGFALDFLFQCCDELTCDEPADVDLHFLALNFYISPSFMNSHNGEGAFGPYFNDGAS
jgi:hypothetical protein